MDLFKFYPALKKAMPLTNENVRTAFVVVFIPVRIVYWPYVCSEFWQGALCSKSASSSSSSSSMGVEVLAG